MKSLVFLLFTIYNGVTSTAPFPSWHACKEAEVTLIYPGETVESLNLPSWHGLWDPIEGMYRIRVWHRPQRGEYLWWHDDGYDKLQAMCMAVPAN